MSNSMDKTKQVIIFPSGQLKASDRKKLEANGIIAIEAEDPSKVVMLPPVSTLIKGDDLLMSILKGINSPSHGCVSISDRNLHIHKTISFELENRLLLNEKSKQDKN